MNRYIGIDPGVSGGIAMLTGDDSYVTQMPRSDVHSSTCQEIYKWISHAVGEPDETWAAVELVGGFIQGNPSPGSAMFVFGRSAGWIDMALVAAGVRPDRIIIVPPRVWQQTNEVEVRKFQRDSNNKKITTESKSDFKYRLVETAKKFFPNRRVLVQHADALLIARHLKIVVERAPPARKPRRARALPVARGSSHGESSPHQERTKSQGGGGFAAGEREEAEDRHRIPATDSGDGGDAEGREDHLSGTEVQGDVREASGDEQG